MARTFFLVCLTLGVNSFSPSCGSRAALRTAGSRPSSPPHLRAAPMVTDLSSSLSTSTGGVFDIDSAFAALYAAQQTSTMYLGIGVVAEGFVLTVLIIGVAFFLNTRIDTTNKELDTTNKTLSKMGKTLSSLEGKLNILVAIGAVIVAPVVAKYATAIYLPATAVTAAVFSRPLYMANTQKKKRPRLL